MSTTCQTIYARAKRFSLMNASLAPTKPEVLARIESEQQAVFAMLASQHRDRYQVSTTANSTNAASSREIDLSVITPVVLRVLKLAITSSGEEVNQVDVLDQDADFAPRYFVRGQKLIEVGSDWGASGVIGMTLIYVQGPTAITASGAYSQTITIPDEWADLLVLPLAMYLFQIAGPMANTDQAPQFRTAEEYQRLEKLLAEKREAFAEYLKNYGGVEVRRFMLPTTRETRKN